ncbi:hypothetical protein [Cyclobacterium jeungdonense]|uniref:Uncharacterized protein n=1 Tax=Cyclobacterium jeungdonense TaxID=708087 RepID=A0ABT8CAJ5_9BACT|nr:hypothetical protein [Cyclobacterium jeungdonense]MDN3688833.1 hypothetical protein [Cyclobacterium jeungdonense]
MKSKTVSAHEIEHDVSDPRRDDYKAWEILPIQDRDRLSDQ